MPLENNDNRLTVYRCTDTTCKQTRLKSSEGNILSSHSSSPHARYASLVSLGSSFRPAMGTKGAAFGCLGPMFFSFMKNDKKDKEKEKKKHRRHRWKDDSYFHAEKVGTVGPYEKFRLYNRDTGEYTYVNVMIDGDNCKPPKPAPVDKKDLLLLTQDGKYARCGDIKDNYLVTSLDSERYKLADANPSPPPPAPPAPQVVIAQPPASAPAPASVQMILPVQSYMQPAGSAVYYQQAPVQQHLPAPNVYLQPCTNTMQPNLVYKHGDKFLYLNANPRMLLEWNPATNSWGTAHGMHLAH